MITNYKDGDYVACCGRCRHKMYASMLKPDGRFPTLLVCDRCWDRPHPNDTPSPVPREERPLRHVQPLGNVESTSVIITEDDY
jgi:hypothetical protein